MVVDGISNIIEENLKCTSHLNPTAHKGRSAISDYLPINKDSKQLEELRKNVNAQEDKLGEALKIFNQLTQKLPEERGKDSEIVVLYETLNTALTILGDLVASYRRYTEELESVIISGSRRRTGQNRTPASGKKTTSGATEKKAPEVAPEV